MKCVQIIPAVGYEAVYATRPERKGDSFLERVPIIAWGLSEDGERLVGFHPDVTSGFIGAALEDDDELFLGYRQSSGAGLQDWEETGELVFREWLDKAIDEGSGAHPLEW